MEGIEFEKDNYIQIEKLKKTNEFKDYNDQQIYELMQITKTFADIIYDIWVKEQSMKTIEIESFQLINKAA